MVRDEPHAQYRADGSDARQPADPEIDRRGLLRGVATAAAGGVVGAAGLSGVASAEREARAAAERLSSRDGIRTAFRTHGEDLVAELGKRGFLESDDVADLTIPEPAADATDGHEAAAVAIPDEDGPTTVAVLTRRLDDDRELVAGVERESGRAYGLVKPPGLLSDGDHVTVLRETEDGWVLSTREMGAGPTRGCEYACHDGSCDCYQRYVDHNFQVCYATTTRCGICYGHCPY
jgi:hypothetical protein